MIQGRRLKASWTTVILTPSPNHSLRTQGLSLLENITRGFESFNSTFSGSCGFES